MSDIPEDVVLAAQAEMAKGDTAFMTVARAILAERERCAQIAENKANKHGWNYHLPSVGREIASAIRSPERAGE